VSILEIKNLNKYYKQGKDQVHILKNISFKVEEGDFLGIVGSSGSGKTTLLYSMSGLEKIASGEIIYKEKSIADYNEEKMADLRKYQFGFVFQFYNLIPNLTAYENVLLANILAEKNDEDYIRSLLDTMGLKAFYDYYPNELSGGMQQRVAIARALVNRPKILFADEPTGNLDQKKGKEIMGLLKKLNKEYKLTIILVTHNEDYLKYCNKKLDLLDGEVVG
jgi:putative ABC transport system ATP-binding protein